MFLLAMLVLPLISLLTDLIWMVLHWISQVQFGQ